MAFSQISHSNQQYYERIAIARSNIQHLRSLLDNPQAIQEDFLKKLSDTLQYSRYMSEVLDEIIRLVFDSKNYLANIGELDFWQAQLLRLFNPITNMIKSPERQLELFALINSQLIFINSLKDNASTAHRNYETALSYLKNVDNDAVDLLIQIEFYNAVIEKWDIRRLIQAEAIYDKLFKQAHQYADEYTLHRAYHMIARYYLRSGTTRDKSKVFGYAQAAFMELWYKSHDTSGLNYLGSLAHIFIQLNKLDYAEKLLQYWSKIRYHLDLRDTYIYSDALYSATWGYLHYANHNYELAEQQLSEAYRHYQFIRHNENMGRILLKLGSTYNKLRQYKTALTTYKIANDFYQALKIEEYQVFVQHGIGWTYLNMGDTSQANKELEKAMEMAQKYPQVLATTINSIKLDLSKTQVPSYID